MIHQIAHPVFFWKCPFQTVLKDDLHTPDQTDSAEHTDKHYNVLCCSQGGLHCAAKGLAPNAKQWLMGACHSSYIWRWEVVYENAQRDVCQALWPSSTVFSNKTLHSGTKNPWSDTKGTLISNLNEKSVETADASVQIGSESHFKTSCHVMSDLQNWISCGFFCCSDLIKSIWTGSGFAKNTILGWQSEQGLKSTHILSKPWLTTCLIKIFLQ